MTRTSLEIESPQGHHVLHIPHERQQLPLTELLRQAGLPLNTRCGQRGLCDGCIVDLLSGSLAHAATGEIVTGREAGVALRACSHRLAGTEPVRVRIPPRSLLAYQPQIVTDFRINIPRAHHPLLQVLEVHRRDLDPGFSPADAICRVATRQFNHERMARISPLARAQAASLSDAEVLFATAAIQVDHWLILDVAATAPPRPLLGAAIDIGTTTVACLLVDLASGAVVGRSAAFNQQMLLGDDVVTRITLCSGNERMVAELQAAVASRTILPLLREAAQKASASTDQIACLSIAGNTTMQHLAAGVNPRSMGVAPFTPIFLDHRLLSADAVFGPQSRQACSAFAPIHILPSASAYIGADLCAGVVATGLLYDEGPSLLVDVGTNGEIILKHGDRLFGCATAAGPAFEGAGLSCGVRAGDGAISHVNLASEPFELRVRSIGQEKSPPIGLCGSAYIDFLAEARRIGLLTATGRYDTSAADGIASRIIPWRESDLAFLVAQSRERQPIVISQRDIAHLLQAKAAIAAGVLTLLHQCGLTPADVKTVYLAGGFGTHMHSRNAIGCGLLPGFSPAQIQAVGNTSLAGAFLALMDSTVMDELKTIGRKLQVVELNLDPDFESRYIDQLSLPEPNERT